VDDAPVTEYREDLSGTSPESIVGFFVGWPRSPGARALHRVLSRSTHVVLAWEDERVIGLTCALSDGELAASIPLLEVLPPYRGRGIGTEMVRRLLDRLHDVYMVDLVCDEELAPFYERLGLERLQAMSRRNRSAPVLGSS
jgi:GNAT superfamily N-acetyltransferase